MWSVNRFEFVSKRRRIEEFFRIDTVAVMDNESVSFIATHTFSKLLKRPLGFCPTKNSIRAQFLGPVGGEFLDCLELQVF